MAIKDLTGQRFGKLTAIKPTDQRCNRSIMWECKCDCGNITYVAGHNLRAGKSTSCGCGKGKTGADLTGQRFGNLTAIKPTDERRNGSVMWECKCDCGNTVYARAIALRSNHNQSCGCLNPNKAMDITGQRFGKLTAIRPTDQRRDKGVVWECKCDCGNTTYVKAGALRSGNTTSCGCEKGKKPSDLTGQRFGKLTAVEPTEKRTYGNVIWKCRCDCGSIKYVSAHNLRNGGTKSCGCSRRAGRLTDY